MFPPSGTITFNLQALSGVSGSISIACWIVVFSPQILQNFKRGSAEGLSLSFLIVWLVGDVFNIVGAVMQGVLPTMIILAAYYTLADIILLLQCLYYRRKNRRRPEAHRRTSATHLSPATPLLDPPKTPTEQPAVPIVVPNVWAALLLNFTAIATVVLAGVIGWYLSTISPAPPSRKTPDPEFSLWGQIFGYACAALYLFSRIPQILLNHKRRSCEGVSILFFLFAGIGNLTYVMSILAFTPDGTEWDSEKYWRYIAVNFSWLLGSLGTLLLDGVIFGQFFWYENVEDGEESEDEEDGMGNESRQTAGAVIGRDEERAYGSTARNGE